MTRLLTILITKTKWQVFFLAAAITLLYARTLSFDFIGLDEQSLLLDKREFNKELSSIPKAFSQHVFEQDGKVSSSQSVNYYRPLLTTSFILDQQFSKEGFTFYRFTNIFIHLAASIGLLFLLRQLKTPAFLAFLFSLLFAVHPLLTQAIAWIPGRNDSLACAFVLWSFYFLASQERAQRTLLHLLFFTLALFTKENTVALTILCVYYIFLLKPGNFTQKSKITLCISYAGILLLWFIARKHAIDTSSLPIDGGKDGSLLLLLQYFQKTILPFNLSVMSTVKDTNYGWVFLAGGLFGTALYFTRNIPWKEINFGLLWFTLFFLPTLLFSYFEGMEHRAYLPMIGLLIALAHTEPLQNLTQNTTKPFLVFGVVILVFGAITYVRIPIFAEERTYWEDAFHSSEHSAVVCRDYGVILTKAGEYAKAEQAFMEGIKRNPKEILLHYNLGAMYYKTGNFEPAETQLLQELRIDSTNNPLTYHLLGLIYKQTDKKEQAKRMWKKTLQLNPDFEPAAEEIRNIH